VEPTVQEICSWLEIHVDKALLIQKVEQQDTDRVELEVQEVGLLDQTESADDYVTAHSIVLRGTGTIQNQMGEKVNLPQDYYEIPLEGAYQYVLSTDSIEIHTERAHYSIEVQ
jgi:hypothetical protein